MAAWIRRGPSSGELARLRLPRFGGQDASHLSVTRLRDVDDEADAEAVLVMFMALLRLGARSHLSRVRRAMLELRAHPRAILSQSCTVKKTGTNNTAVGAHSRICFLVVEILIDTIDRLRPGARPARRSSIERWTMAATLSCYSPSMPPTGRARSPWRKEQESHKTLQ